MKHNCTGDFQKKNGWQKECPYISIRLFAKCSQLVDALHFFPV